MSNPQSAILPEAGPFAQYTLLKIKQNPQSVVEKLKALPKLVEELNQQQPGANLTLSIAFTKSFWTQLDAAMPPELIDFPVLGEGEVVAPSSDVDVLL
ncbi:Dyp-type peroxidase domain-containing protein, partial [Vibrio sinaloensis]|uniref:Dyp-type peroxidase domain-containing protein n=1 Tax=Photobacterium sp. (strain ATCC 43367) TaxID=379097 RepID=UPI002F3E69ED